MHRDRNRVKPYGLRFMRARPPTPFKHGPERLEERPPHVKHVDWHALFPDELILRGPVDRKAIALTFDDGPDDQWTPQILRVLRENHVRVTFMCVGERIQQTPNQFRQLIQQGHIIGNHSFDHPNFTKITLTEAKTQIERTNDLIENIADIQPRFFRPPYGALNEEVIREVIELDMKILLWDVDSLDWSGITAEQTESNVLAHAQPGSIILMHCAGGRGENLSNTVQALPKTIQTLRSEGYTFKTVPELLGVEAYE